MRSKMGLLLNMLERTMAYLGFFLVTTL